MVKLKLLTRPHTVILRPGLWQTTLHFILVPGHYVAVCYNELDSDCPLPQRACCQAQAFSVPQIMSRLCRPFPFTGPSG